MNTELIDLYWEIGKILSQKTAQESWGAKIVADLARYLKRAQPSLKGYSRPNLMRMKQFHETYQNDSIVSPLVRQLPWSHNLLILSQTKQEEERLFYLKAASKERWSKREHERQLNGARFERVMLARPIVSPVATQFQNKVKSVFRDSYLVDFLHLSESHSEADLHQGLIENLRHFLTELGRDFCFIGSEHPIYTARHYKIPVGEVVSRV